MSCFCVRSLGALATPNINLALTLNLNASAELALDLHAELRAGIPDLEAPDLDLAAIASIDVSLLSSVSAWLSLQLQLRQTLGIDLNTSLGLTAMARLAATLNARLQAIMALQIDFSLWIRLAELNRISLEIEAILNASAGASGSLSAEAVAAIAVPGDWGGVRLQAISVLMQQQASLGVSLDAEFLASLSVNARLAASAMANVELDMQAAVELSAGISAILSLRASLGIDPLTTDPITIRAMVGANFNRMVQVCLAAGIDLSAGAGLRLPWLPALPGFRLALVQSLELQLQAALRFVSEQSFAFGVGVPLDAGLAAEAYLAISLAINLDAMFSIDLVRRTPCAQCDLRDVMAAIADMAAARQLASASSLPPSPSPAGAPTAAAATAANATAANAPPAAGAPGRGGGAGGGGGGGGGGGVPATVMTAQLMCPFGVAPSALTVLPINRTTCGKQIAANIMDHIPMVNILPFGMCMSIANPTVAAATTAALGVLTPMPCIPVTPSPWVPGAPTVLLGKQPMLDQTSKCMCNWAGVIQIVSPGQMQTTIP